MKRKRLMVLGAGTYQKPLLEYASKHYDVVLVAPGCDDEARRMSVVQYEYDIRDRESILRMARKERIDGIITDQTDMAVRTVAYVANRCGLPGNPYEVACLYTDKARMREAQIKAGIPVLPNCTVSTLEEALSWYKENSFSLIIKPLDNQGSRGVAAVRSESDLISKFDEAKRYSSTGKVLLEKFATGRQFCVEGVALNGEYRSMICSDDEYFDLGDCFAARSRVFSAELPTELHRRVVDFNDRINKEFGIRQGLSHAEYIMDGDNLYLIEVGARGGGAYISSDIIPRAAGLNTAEYLCRIACGDVAEIPSFSPVAHTVGYVAFYIPEGEVISVDGIENVQLMPFVHRNTFSSIKVGKVYGASEDKTGRQLGVVSASSRSEWLDRVALIRAMIKIKVKNSAGQLVGPIW